MKALIVVDVQNDFCEGGALAVAGGNGVAQGVNRHVRETQHYYDLVVYTMDWHNAPPDNNGGHFALPPATPDFVDLWPVHCVAGTEGADFHPAIAELPKREDAIFKKGQGRPDYSGFQGVNEDGKSLADFLRQHGIKEIHTVGIAGEHCVKETAFSGLREEFGVIYIPHLVASVGGDEATYRSLNEVVDLELSLKSS